ncbi:MAG: hypothetical protein UT50_C0001G0058 [Candidatus Moranbacteria bacterium GW2011_GWA2_39_41]|nr:MAG: hypothetical protein UT50_C0001G0058 [Candidatus Moranbacteria bacterium GW2011_GWA2_39_41]
MKLLLTSAGLSNKSITDTLLELTGRPFAGLNLAFISEGEWFEIN